MSIEYTAEDFAQATFAVHPDPAAVDARYAARMNRDPEYPWLLDGVPGNGDEHMAADGWVPVVEATEVMQNRQIDAEAHLDQIERLSKRLAAAGDQVESQRLVIEALREENDRLERILQAPLRMRDLEVAWEAAEEADTCNAGDVLITRHAPEGSFEIGPAKSRGCVNSGVARILSRAPREPWQDLADVLRAWDAAPEDADADGMAKWFHERGVRVTGGGER